MVYHPHSIIKNLFCSLLGLLSIAFFTLQAETANPFVLVSVSPHKFFVEQIAGDTLKVGLMVPAGASAHTYEPTPKQMMAASGATIWFRIGEPFENKAIQALKSHHPELKIVDLRQGLDLIAGSCCCHQKCHAQSMDLHFWLSARLAQIQAETIAKALMEVYPEHTEVYKANLAKFQADLKGLDEKIQEILKPIKNRHILVSHPAYAYFCRDYGLSQYSIEVEGKDPTPQQLTRTLQLARRLNIRTIFIQIQYNNKGARLVADEIGANIVTLDPYAEDYYPSMLAIAHAFAEG